MNDRKTKKQRMIDYLDLHHPVLKEEDFYPVPDDRMRFCGIDDIPGGDNYAEFAEEFYELYEEDLFD